MPAVSADLPCGFEETFEDPIADARGQLNLGQQQLTDDDGFVRLTSEGTRRDTISQVSFDTAR